MLDAPRAIRLTRAHAAEWDIDPAKVGIMGFSAGGHLAATAGTRFDAGSPDAANPVDGWSSRPDFMIWVYPVISMMEPVTHMGSRSNLLGENPTDDLVHADDGAVPVKNSLLFYDARLAYIVPAELHVYPKGGHGFSLALSKGRLQDWTPLCARWLGEL